MIAKKTDEPVEFEVKGSIEPATRPQFRKLRIEGGPEGTVTGVTLDGEPVGRCHRLELVADVRDAVRVKMYEIVEVIAELDVEIGEPAFVAGVYQLVVEKGQKGRKEVRNRIAIGEGHGHTLPEALRDAAALIEASDGLAQA